MDVGAKMKQRYGKKPRNFREWMQRKPELKGGPKKDDAPKQQSKLPVSAPKTNMLGAAQRKAEGNAQQSDD